MLHVLHRRRIPDGEACSGGEGQDPRCRGHADPISLQRMNAGCCIRSGVTYRTEAGDARVPARRSVSPPSAGTCWDVAARGRGADRSPLLRALATQPENPLSRAPLTLEQARYICSKPASVVAPPLKPLPEPEGSGAATVVGIIGKGERTEQHLPYIPLLGLLCATNPVFLIFQNQDTTCTRASGGETVALSTLLKALHVSAQREGGARLQLLDLRGSAFPTPASLWHVLRHTYGLLWLGLSGIRVDGTEVHSRSELASMSGGEHALESCRKRGVQLDFHEHSPWGPLGIFALSLPLEEAQNLTPQRFAEDAAAATAWPGGAARIGEEEVKLFVSSRSSTSAHHAGRSSSRAATKYRLHGKKA